MSMKSYPFDSEITGYEADGSPIYDRAADSAVLANWMKHYFSDGVFMDQASQTLGFQVLSDSSGMNVNISAGACEIQGRFAYDENVTTIKIPDADTIYSRIDTVVLRLNLENDVRNIHLAVISGTPASSPAAPALTRNRSVYELGIANILVSKNSKVILQSSITDTRLDTERCGIVCVPMQVMDSRQLYVQIQNDLSNFRREYEDSFDNWSEASRSNFDAWFYNVQATLNESADGNLYNLILENGFQTYTHIKNEMVHELVCEGGIERNIRFVATGRFNLGDRFSIGGAVVIARMSDGTPLYDGYFVAGAVVVCFYDSKSNVLSFIGSKRQTPDEIGALPSDGTAVNANKLGGKDPSYYMPDYGRGKVLWEGNWSSGAILVDGSMNYTGFKISMSGQGASILAMRQGAHIRGVGGYSSAEPRILTYHFAATDQDEIWTFVACNNIVHSVSGEHGSVTNCTVTSIIGLF